MENKLVILAVDDNTINLATIEQELKDTYDVITVNSGARALQYLKQAKPDLILLDIQMALMDGIETLKQIRAMGNGESIPVIMLTSKQDKETIIESSKLGVYDYVLKPFKADNLQERIVRTLKRAGVIEVQESEIYEKIRDVVAEIRGKNSSNAVNKIDEVLRFKIDEEIAGRLQNARFRLKNDDTIAALRVMERVLQMMERNITDNGSTKVPISESDINDWLKLILSDLENFKVHEASKKLETLQNFLLPAEAKEFCDSIQRRLEEYDDGAAETEIRRRLTGESGTAKDTSGADIRG